jgi:hypothetical protein
MFTKNAKQHVFIWFLSPLFMYANQIIRRQILPATDRKNNQNYILALYLAKIWLFRENHQHVIRDNRCSKKRHQNSNTTMTFFILSREGAWRGKGAQ